ncbi:hypothetical protein ACVBEQ_13925 [Nakamurella sp. GG22]
MPGPADTVTAITPDPGGQAVDPDERRAALALSTLLLLAGVLVGVSPLLGVVGTADGSPTTAVAAAALAAVLPGLLAVGLAVRRPVLGLAATAGAGVIGVVRLLTDVAVLSEPDRVTRPELFAETTERARPFTAAAGGWVLVLADVLWLTVGVLAAMRLATQVAPGRDEPDERIFSGPNPDPVDPIPPDADVSAGAIGDVEIFDGTQVAAALSRASPGRRSLNMPMVLVGFLGAILLMVGALGTPYSGGYLALRVLPFGSSLTGLVGAALLGFVAAVVVVIAAALPTSIGRALLGGTALAAAVPGLTAVLAVLFGAPTSLSPVVWCGLLGALVLALAGLLSRRTADPAGARDPDGSPPPGWMTIGTGVLALLAAAALVGAGSMPLLYLDGAAPDDVAGGALLPAALPQLVAAAPLTGAGVLALVPSLAVLGRAAATVVWAGAVYAFGQALLARSLVLSTTGDSTGTEHFWTTGPGQWFSVLGTLCAIAAAVLGVLTMRRVEQASPAIVDDDTLAAARSARVWPAVGLTALIVVGLSLPAHSDLTGSGPGLWHGYDLDTWGIWALAIGGVIGVWAAALTHRAGAAAAWLVASAAVVGQSLIVPPAVRAVAGFGWGAGLWAAVLAVLALLVAAPFFAKIAQRVRIDTPAPLAGITAARRTTTPPKGSAPAGTTSKGR